MSLSDNILKKHKLRITQFRSEVIDIFNEAGRALSSNDIEAKLKDADRITLYRTLKNFEDKGIIHRAMDGTQTQKYAMCEAECDEYHHHDEHVHFHCENCENTFCMDNVFVPKIILPNGFKMHNAHMVINGRCKNCG